MIWGVSRDTSGEILQSQLVNTSVKNVRNSDCSKEADRKVYQSGNDQKPQSSTYSGFISKLSKATCQFYADIDPYL